MAKYFTSIFHEEVISIDEFKGEAEAYYAAKRDIDSRSNRHDPHSKEMRKRENEVAERGNRGERLDGKGKRSTNIQDAKNRKEFAGDAKRVFDARENHRNVSREVTKKYADIAKKEKAQNESFLLDIELI